MKVSVVVWPACTEESAKDLAKSRKTTSSGAVAGSAVVGWPPVRMPLAVLVVLV